MSLTHWSDEQALHASEAALTDVRGEAASRFSADAPVAENYEIAVQQRLKPSEAANWVRLTTLRGDPAKVGDGVRHFESTVVPALSEVSGFRGAVLFVDRATGGSLIATVWDSREDLERSAGDVTSIRSGAADAMGATDPQVESYEMAFRGASGAGRQLTRGLARQRFDASHLVGLSEVEGEPMAAVRYASSSASGPLTSQLEAARD